MTDPLIPVVAQDVRTNNVLMLAWANRESLARTRRTGAMHYWSRSRNRLWRKGEQSGHTQKVRSLHYDCDRDTILARVEQTGPACHRKTFSCFADAPFPAEDIFAVLEATIAERRRSPKKGSYTNKLLAAPATLRDKLLEEACELMMAAKSGRKKDVAAEAGDLLYHVMVLLASAGVTMGDVKDVLERRKR